VVLCMNAQAQLTTRACLRHLTSPYYRVAAPVCGPLLLSPRLAPTDPVLSRFRLEVSQTKMKNGVGSFLQKCSQVLTPHVEGSVPLKHHMVLIHVRKPKGRQCRLSGYNSDDDCHQKMWCHSGGHLQSSNFEDKATMGKATSTIPFLFRDQCGVRDLV
jgi:hypothetical protein